MNRQTYSNRQPNSRMCFACGMENPLGLKLRFYENGAEVWTDFSIPAQFQGYPGVAHGGIVAAILDEVGGRTVMIGDPLRLFVTAKLEVRYRRPTPTDTPLRAVGRMGPARGRLWSAHAEILDSAGSILAEAELLLAPPPPAVFTVDEADRLGWRVYDE